MKIRFSLLTTGSLFREAYTYTDQVTFKTDLKTDQKIYDATVAKADRVNSGQEKYNPLTNSCTDGCEDPITEATGVELPGKVRPNASFYNLKDNQESIQTQLDLSSGKATLVTPSSNLDGYHPKPVIIPAVPQVENNQPHK